VGSHCSRINGTGLLVNGETTSCTAFADHINGEKCPDVCDRSCGVAAVSQTTSSRVQVNTVFVQNDLA